MSNSDQPLGLGCSEGLGLGPERDGVLAQLDDRTNQFWAGKRARWAALVRAQDAEIARLRGELACAAQDCFTAESRPLPTEWLVKVRRLVHGFEHVSGIARLWEPDYSTGSDRALWSRATEACADVAKLLREAEGPNVRANSDKEAR